MRFTGARASAIQPSATLELAARAKAMLAAGEPVLDLSAGEPDLPTPAAVVEAAHRALDEGHFGYTATPGVPALRQAIANCYGDRLGLQLAAQNVVVSNGAKQALFNALAAIVDPGDRVAIFCPYWTSYVEQIRFLDAEPVLIHCSKESGFRPDIEGLQRAIDGGLRALLVNSPCNPTGAVLGEDDWRAIAACLAPTETLLISDEIYEELVYDTKGHQSPVTLQPQLAERTCVVSGLSKAYAMTGWRVGYSIAPAAWSKPMATLQGHMTSNINAVTQQAAIAAITRHDLVAPLRAAFVERRERLLARFGELEPLRAQPPMGAFYLYVDVSPLGMSGSSFAASLLEQEKVVVVPGEAFGDDQHVRLSFATAVERLDEAVDRMARFLRSRAEREPSTP